jgi:hypothetical protein
MALFRPRVVLGVFGGLITAITLQGCFEDSVNSLIENACKAKAGQFVNDMKDAIAETARDKCLELLGNDTMVNGKTCETETVRNFTKDAEDQQANITAECIDYMTSEYDKLSSSSSSLLDLPDLVANMTTNFLNDRASQLEDMKDTIMDEVTDAIDGKVDLLIETSCSGIIQDMKTSVLEAANEKCLELIGNDTQIHGKNCETEIAERYSSASEDEQANIKSDCIDSLTTQYDKVKDDSLSVSAVTALIKNMTTSFFKDHESLIQDMTDEIMDEIKDDADEPGRLYVVADSDKIVGAPRLAIGGPLAMIATGTLAVAVAARSCSRRRAFQAVCGDEQAAVGSAQHA